MAEVSVFRELRKSLGLSQKDVAKAVGVCRATVNRYEQGHHAPQPRQRKIIEAWMERYAPHSPPEIDKT